MAYPMTLAQWLRDTKHKGRACCLAPELAALVEAAIRHADAHPSGDWTFVLLDDAIRGLGTAARREGWKT